MYTRRTFLAFAAAAQLVSPNVRAAAVPPGAAGRLALARLPTVLPLAYPGRDIHFHNDLAAGRLAILDLRYDLDRALGPASLLDGARRAAGSRQAGDFYAYALTMQPAIRDEEALRRYMEWYGATGRGELPPAARDIELLRLRFGVLTGER
ncbi:hypothetical protein [Massilia suwonensis]|uniref:Uncharacterized protein n=1 Tax=Massilia suwonensis TaxID=648895 RepID=A0ABW0MTZ3_9BURK